MYEIKTEDILKVQKGNKEILGSIVEKNSGLVWSIVKRFLGRGYDKEELYQVGCIGLIKAIKRFDTSLELKLSTYAVPYIMGEIKRFIRDDNPIKISRSLKELAVKIKEIQKEYLSVNGKEISIDIISKKLKVSNEEITMALEIDNPIESINEESYSSGMNSKAKINKISNGKNEEELVVEKMCISSIIEKLNDKEKQIILLRYYRDKTQTEVAKLLGISQVQISRIEKRILQNMKSELLYKE